MKKDKACLVTQGLIGKVDWFITAPETVIKEEKGGDGKITWKEKAYNELCSTLRREKTPFPEAAKKGVDFERILYKQANALDPGGSELFKRMCEEIKGYEYYQKGGLNKTIGGENCYLYGKYDAIKKEGGKIIYIKDVKTTANYSPNKYLKGIQHKMYCYISECDTFKYVIAEWDEYPKISEVYVEYYQVEDRELLENEIIHTVEDLFSTLADLNLWNDYREKFCLY